MPIVAAVTTFFVDGVTKDVNTNATAKRTAVTLLIVLFFILSSPLSIFSRSLCDFITRTSIVLLEREIELKWNFYQKGAYLVDGACLAIYDQDKMLNKIYGKQKVNTWDNLKKHEVYKHLIAREYSSMLNESRKNNKSNLW